MTPTEIEKLMQILRSLVNSTEDNHEAIQLLLEIINEHSTIPAKEALNRAPGTPPSSGGSKGLGRSRGSRPSPTSGECQDHSPLPLPAGELGGRPRPLSQLSPPPSGRSGRCQAQGKRSQLSLGRRQPPSQISPPPAGGSGRCQAQGQRSQLSPGRRRPPNKLSPPPSRGSGRCQPLGQLSPPPPGGRQAQGQLSPRGSKGRQALGQLSPIRPDAGDSNCLAIPRTGSHGFLLDSTNPTQTPPSIPIGSNLLGKLPAAAPGYVPDFKPARAPCGSHPLGREYLEIQCPPPQNRQFHASRSNGQTLRVPGPASQGNKPRGMGLSLIPTWTQYFAQHKLTPLSSSLRSEDNAFNFQVDGKINDKVSIWQGDISKLEIDAIVNAANKELRSGGGVCGAIHAAAGSQLQAECRALGGCEVGNSKMTMGYNLPAKYVIQTVGPKGEKPGLLKSAYDSALTLMLNNNLQSIAFPSISTGIYGYPPEKAAHVACLNVRAFLEINKDKIDRIIFTLFSPDDLKRYQKLMQIYFPISK